MHKLSHSQLQRFLLVRHEEASAKVQRQIIEWRRVELHKIFSEELEEATRMGELEKSTAKSLQHDYFDCQVSDWIFHCISAICICGQIVYKAFKTHKLHNETLYLSRISWR